MCNISLWYFCYVSKEEESIQLFIHFLIIISFNLLSIQPTVKIGDGEMY